MSLPFRASVEHQGVTTIVSCANNSVTFDVKYSGQGPAPVVTTSAGPAAGAFAASASKNGVTTDFTKPNNTISLAPLQPTVPSETQSRNSGGTAGILPAERKKATFDVERLINVLDGGAERTARRRFIISPSEGTDASDRYYLDRHQALRKHLEHFIKVHDKFMGKFVPTREEVAWMTEYTMMSGTMMNHWGLFLPTILGQASDEQLATWLPLAFTMQIVGCYAQTELGHGSNVRGLQTTAVYDKNTQVRCVGPSSLLAIALLCVLRRRFELT